MSIDIDQIKGKLKKLQEESNNNGGNSGGNILWKPDEGEQIVRIVPYKENPSNPFIEMYTHFNFGGDILTSPISYGDPDPIYEFGQQLKQQGDEESYNQSKRFEPSMRTYVPVLVRGKEEEGVKYWGFGKQVYEQILGYIADPDWGDITHPKTGRDIKVTYEIPEGWPKNKSNGFPKTTILPKPNQKPAYEDLDKLKEMINNQPEIKKIFKPLSYAELEQKLNAYLDKGGSDNSSSNQNSKNSSSTTDASDEEVPWDESDTQKDNSSVEDAFDELFNGTND